jgi:hypothetical protein
MHPGSTPPVTLDTVAAYEEPYSVYFVNAQPDTEQKLFGSMGIHDYTADCNEWTEFLVSLLTEEFKKRGADVSADNGNVINVIVSDFAYITGMWSVRTNVKITVSTPDGTWSKVYSETDTSGWSMGRAFGSLFHHFVIKVMEDEEFMGQIRGA